MRMSSCRMTSVVVTPPTSIALVLSRPLGRIGDSLSDTALVRSSNLIFRFSPPKLDREALVF